MTGRSGAVLLLVLVRCAFRRVPRRTMRARESREVLATARVARSSCGTLRNCVLWWVGVIARALRDHFGKDGPPAEFQQLEPQQSDVEIAGALCSEFNRCGAGIVLNSHKTRCDRASVPLFAPTTAPSCWKVRWMRFPHRW